MRRSIAHRKHKNGCDECGRQLLKGDVYYTARKVFTEDDQVYAWQYKMCARCNYYYNRHDKRYQKFREVCVHPDKFVETIWVYMQGECVKEPDHDECRLCGAIVWR